jgi:hypothetical protein
VTPLERHCRWLLRSYPAWYRRERAGEMLDTLLEANPPGRRWPSIRDARALVIGGMRVRGCVVWLLSILWAALGAAGAGYIFLLSTHVPAIPTYSRIPCWVGEPGAFILAGELGAMAWVVLTIPVLFIVAIRVRRWTVRAGAWVIVWTAGVILMILVARWQTAARAIIACSGQGCSLSGYSGVVVSWGELGICAAYLAIGAAIILILRWPTPSWHQPGVGGSSATKASL